MRARAISSGSQSIDMRKIIFKSLLSILALLFVLPLAETASAHGGEPRLEISGQNFYPGSALDIRGVDFEFEEEISLALIGFQVEAPLGVIVSDSEGIFQLTVTLPVNLTEGIYIIRATTDDHVVESLQISVSGTAAVEDGNQREQEEPLLAPMPTYAPDVIPTTQSAIQPAITTAESAPDRNSLATILAVLLGMGILAALGSRAMRKN